MKYVNISSRCPLIFDTRVVAIFWGEAENFQEVPILAGLKTGKMRTWGVAVVRGRLWWGHIFMVFSAILLLFS